VLQIHIQLISHQAEIHKFGSLIGSLSGPRMGNLCQENYLMEQCGFFKQSSSLPLGFWFWKCSLSGEVMWGARFDISAIPLDLGMSTEVG